MSRSPLRPTRRRIVGSLLVGLAVAFVAHSTSSQAAGPETSAIQAGLNQFATATQGLANVADTDTPDHLSFLTGKIPFSKLKPLANEGLALSSLLQQSFDNLGALTDPGSLASALNHRDTDLANGVHVTLGCGDGTTGCGHPVAISPTGDGAAAYDLTLPFAASRVADVPIALPTDAADLSGPSSSGGKVRITLNLSGVFSIHYDSNNADPTLRFTLSAPTALHFSAAVAAHDALSFPVDLGFTKITAGTPASDTSIASLSLDVSLKSPHAPGTALAGRISAYDLVNTALTDYATVTRGGSVNASLTLDTALTPAVTPDATVSVSDADLGNGFQPQFIANGGASSSSLATAIGNLSLADFTNVSPTQVLSGLGQLAASLQAVQTAANVHLPLLQNGLADTLKVVNDMVAALAQQTVTCGPTAGNPPSGSLFGLAAGTTIYCQATTTDTVNPGSITWTAVGASATAVSSTSGASANNTVGTVPSVSAQFTTATDNVPPVIIANYGTGAPPVTKGVSQPVPTAQDLLNLLVQNAGFTKSTSIDGHLPTSVAYDASTHALTFHLLKDISTGDANTKATLDFGDRFKDKTGLVGLSSARDAQGNPTSTVTVNAGHAIVDLTFGVILTKNLSDITPHSSPPNILDRFFVQIDPLVHPFSIKDATVTVATHLVGQVGFLQVTADPPAAGSNFAVTPLDTANPILSLDVIPSVAEPFGVATTGGTIANALPISQLLTHISDHVSLTPNIKLVGGVGVAAKVGTNTLGSGDVTFDWAIPSMAELTSASAFHVNASTEFSDSLQKFWEMAKDNPQALLQILLDQLSDLAAQASTASGDSGSVFDTQLPLVGVTPRSLLKQFSRLKDAVDEIKGGALAGTIACTKNGLTDPADTAVAGDTVVCTAKSTSAATAVQWKAYAGASDITAGLANPSDITNVGPNPAGANGFTFTVPPNVTGLASIANVSGFRVHVDFDDAAGHHTADTPTLSAPPSLQTLVAALTSKLGLPENALLASVTPLKKPGGLVAVPTLKLALNYDLCTTGNTVLPGCASGGAGNAIPAINVPLSVNLGALAPGGSGDHPLATQGTIGVEVNGHAQIDLGFPLDSLTTPEILGTTGASLQAAVSGDNLGFQASLGPLSIKLGHTAPNPAGTAASGTGTFRLSGKVSVGETGAQPDQGYSLSDFISGLHAGFTNADGATSCGNFDKDYSDDPSDPNVADPTPPSDVSGVVCGLVDLGLNDSYIGSLGLSWTDFSSAPTVLYPDDLLSKIASEAFSPDFLLKALPALLEQLRSTLSNASGSVKLPVVGDALDAGAGIVDSFNTSLVTPVVNGLTAVIGAVGTPKDMHDTVQTFMFQKLGPAGANLLLDNNHAGGVTAADVLFTVTCSTGNPAPNDTTDCSDSTAGADMLKIVDARFDFQIGQGIGSDPVTEPSTCTGPSPAAACSAPVNLPFDIGLDGLPLRIQGALSPHVGWRMRLNFGLSRNDGPYLIVNHKTGLAKTDDITLGAGIGLGDATSACGKDDPEYLTSSVSEFGKYDDKRCLKGTLGFLEVTVHDADASDAGNHKKSGVDLQTGLRVTGPGGDNSKLTLLNITGIGAEFNVNVKAQVNAFVRAGITGVGAGFPSIAGTFHVGFTWGAGTAKVPLNASSRTLTGPTFNNLYLNAGQVISSFVGPIVKEVQSVTSPLKPIIDTLQAPIPVVSQLAALAGGDPVTLIDLAEKASGADLSVIKSIIALIKFANSINVSPQGVTLVPLGNGTGGGGSFGVAPTKLDAPQPSTATAQTSVVNPQKAGIGGAVANASPTLLADGRYSTFGVPGLDIPWFRDPSMLFQLMMGQDITLVDYQFGGLHATAGFQYTFGPFLVGPVPISIFIGGSIDINGHLGIGYDTTGLREVIEGGGADKLLDGLFFDTFKAGHEAPVIQLVGTVTAGAQVDLVIVKAGIEAGLQLTVNFFWDDPTPDGKMGLQDIAGKLDNPICLFRVSGSLDAFIKAFVEIDLFFYSDRFEFTILQLHLLDFSAACSPPKPEPATVDGGVLKVNIGPRADQRHFHYDPAKASDAEHEQNKEAVVIRSVSGDVHRVSVTLFGFYKEYSGVNSIFADGGIGSDKITLAQGSRTAGSIEVTPANGPTPAVTRECKAENPCNDVPFTLPAEIHGGSGDDVIVGADGADKLDGDGGTSPTPAGSDKISGGSGDDTIVGGPGGTDNLSGDLGSDHVYGGTLADLNNTSSAYSKGTGPVVIQGGPGADFLYGSDNGDQIDGGPGLDPTSPAAAGHASSIDAGDHMYGFKGNDSLNGGPGDDYISGDENLESDTGCIQPGVAPDHPGDADHHQTDNDDVIDAGAGNDHVWAGSGHDAVKGGAGSNFLCGNAGDDTMEGNPAAGSTSDHSTIAGGPDQDILSSGPGDSLIVGGSGNDKTTPGAGNDIVIGGTGRDTVSGGAGNDIELGDDGTVDGKDAPTLTALSPTALGTLISALQGQSLLVRAGHVTGSTGSDSGAAQNCVQAYNQLSQVTGNSDCITGSGGEDIVYAGPGQDNVSGDDGNDYLDGGSGDDYVRGAQLDDYVYGQAGDDQLFGDSGADHVYGGDDRDAIHGGSENDYIEGNDSADTINGDAGADDIIGGSSTKQTLDAPFGPSNLGDVVLGGEDDDVIIGDNGTIVGVGRVVTIFDNNEAASSKYFNDDTLSGNEGADRIFGGGGTDTIHGNELGDYLEGNAGADTIFGDDGSDHILGGSHQEADTAFDTADVIRGGLADDVILGDNGTINDDGTTFMAVTPAGTFGNDVLHGDEGYDQVYGQLGGDTLDGDAGPDYLVGDLGAITLAADPQVWPGGAPHKTVLLIEPQAGDADHAYGGGGDDHVYGGVGDDVLQGNSGDDYMEGNNGKDSLYGLNDGLTAGDTPLALDIFTAGPLAEGDEDDLLGGSSLVNPEDPQQDVGETVMQGGLDADVMLGDNGEIVRTPLNATTWQQDPITGGAKRDVTLRYANATTCGSSCGGDTMQGNEGNDRMYGEGGNDLLNGNDGQDYLEGNQNDDTTSATAGQYGDALFGDAGEDDLIGGSSETALTCGAQALAPCGQPDAGDSLNGGGDADVLAGDNAVVTKVLPPATGDKLTQRSGMTAQRVITLLDLGDKPSAGTFGGDRIKGDDGVDVIFGQNGNDRVNGNNSDDYAEGGPGTDWVQGDDGDDDLVGGSRDVFSGTSVSTHGQLDSADVVTGGSGDDLITGDNAVMLRVGTPSRFVFRVGSSGALETQRSLTLLDLQWSNGYLDSPSRNVYGGDQLSGGSGVDVVFGQDGDDQISGGAGDDYAEGNGGHDSEYGDRTLADVGIAPLSPTPAWPGPVSSDPGNVAAVNGQDDLIGGSSTAVFRDTADDVHGDGGSDYELGDNGVIVRDILDSSKAVVTTVAAAQSAPQPLANRVYAARYPAINANATPPVTAYPVGAAYVRHGLGGDGATRFCLSNAGANAKVCEVSGAFGADNLWGDSGDDTLYGQDGDDHLYGDTGSQAKTDAGSAAVVNDADPTRVVGVDTTNDDDLFGELGADSLWGESGDDAILGDRGGVRDVWQDGSKQYSYAGSQVPKVEYLGLVKGQVIRVTDLLHDTFGDVFVGSGATNAMFHPGLNEGGDDRIHGGTDHDSIHAGFGDDLVNGDSGGDWVFGDDGADVMWGGKGCDATLGQAGNPAVCYPNGVFDAAPHNAAGETQPLVTDYVIGGKGGTSAASLAGASGSDILDWRPRGVYANATGCTPGPWPVDIVSKKTTNTLDPCSWFEMTNSTDDTTPVVAGQPGYAAYLATTVDNQHHQGVDWEYGGWDRDILQGDVADNGPNEGDRLLDWNGTYNLYTHCNSAYGGYNDVRAHSPSWQTFLQNWVYTQGAGQVLSDATTGGTSAFVELALVYPGSDNDHGAGSAYPTTPGHFDNPNACAL